VLKHAQGFGAWRAGVGIERPARGRVETLRNLAKQAGEVLSKRRQTKRLIPTKVWVFQSLLPRSPLGGRLKWGSKGIANVSPVRKSTQAK
jgi:hypothetical protein